MITSIKKSDITKDYKKLLINGIAVNIPCGLSRDLCAALKYAESKNKEPLKEEDIFLSIYTNIRANFGWKVLIHGFIMQRRTLG